MFQLGGEFFECFRLGSETWNIIRRGNPHTCLMVPFCVYKQQTIHLLVLAPFFDPCAPDGRNLTRAAQYTTFIPVFPTSGETRGLKIIVK